MRLDAEVVVRYTHRLRFTRQLFAPDNPTLTDLLTATRDDDAPLRVVVFADDGVLGAWPGLPSEVAHYANRHPDLVRLCGGVQAVSGGESAKNSDAAVSEVLERIHATGLCRRSVVVVIGGGAVLDVVGYAAATAHRGVRLVRVPTTTLAQADSGVGVKNGINAFGQKNYLGTFDVPVAVINDLHFLSTLSERDWRSGFSEAVKVALIKDAAFFEQIEASASQVVSRDDRVAVPILERACQLHFEHIVRGGDPFERTTARPLDFGHWSAHKLEQMTAFELTHGEAVAIGVALDVTYAGLTDLLPWSVVERVTACLKALGFELFHPAMLEQDRLFAGLQEFREHLGGRLTIPMITAPGQSTVVHDMDPGVVCDAIGSLGRLHGQACSQPLA